MEISIYGAFSDDYKSRIWPKIHREQEQVRSDDPKAGEVELPHGRRGMVAATGSGRGKNYLPYRLEIEGVVIALAAPLKEGEQRIAKVELGSLLLMTQGHRNAWSRALGILRDLGVNVTTTKVSRADVCVDLPNFDVEDFVTLWFNRQRVTRAVKGAIYMEGLNVTGFTAGSKNCCLRVYEKRVEMRSQEGTAKFCALRDNRWGGVVPEKATRVEYQLRRDFLREMCSIDTVEELFDRVSDLTRYLTTQWFRLTAENPDAANKNQTKAADAEVWSRVVDDFAAWAGELVERIERREAPLPDNIALERQFVGIIETLAAMSPDVTRGYDELFKIARRAIEKVDAQRREGESIRRRIAHKRSTFAARGVLEFIKSQAEVNQRNAWELHPADCFCDRCRQPAERRQAERRAA